ncbi:MAG: class I SAM-dependent methyltransferase, partial [Microthrixaceae bacterium]|nr:class I SAM-dependent methyltransferase [Microthrixaceae bacterium]
MSVELQDVLAEARLRGLLGPGSLDAHITQAAGFAEAVPDGATFLDLGSGGGVPGLPLLVAR